MLSYLIATLGIGVISILHSEPCDTPGASSLRISVSSKGNKMQVNSFLCVEDHTRSSSTAKATTTAFPSSTGKPHFIAKCPYVQKVMPPKVNSTNSNWINFGNFSYLFIDKQLSWPEAQLECASYGSDLVSIHNEYEEELVKRLVKDARKWFWIGGLAGRSYCWSDHSMWDYIEITPRSPLGVKGCIAINYSRSTVTSKMFPCEQHDTVYSFVCKKWLEPSY
ncbi:hypothetical protein QR680_016128 [Steinernema hermaphroditum]|uniref:C-type lectin domain-containing protein n=1 Tax=Steinernema hermaphroditum TaxID=289476 RepID=A0AA39HA58_9BILA|nr:hypothetical protein QR680_016128 [Steinernema hermaphroditum]